LESCFSKWIGIREVMARSLTESRMLTTTAQVLEALGGDHAVSALTGSPYKATENWKRAKNFPSRYFLVMTHALRRKRLSAPASLWGMVTPEERRAALTGMIADQRSRAAS
jgi:hypothetical protein